MTDAEQFLADLEAKAKAIFSTDQGECTLVEAQAILEDFSMAANPAAVLRLVGMVRELQAEVERREKEADWLANRLNNTFINQCCFCRDGIKQHTVKCECTKTWRDIARKAVEEED